MELLLEFIFMIIFEGAEEIIKNEKINKTTRKVVFLTISTFNISISVILVLIAVSINSILAQIFLTVVSIFIVVMTIKAWKRIRK